MESALAFARGPLFTACFLLMALGLSRLVFLRSWEYRQSWRRASRESFPFGKALREMAMWLFPLARLHRVSQVIGVVSFVFHIGLILVPLFLAEHVLLWRRGVGLSWWTLPRTSADVLTLLTVATALTLFGIRTFHPAARFMSRVSDYLLLVLLIVPFASGFLASHPQWNPFSYQATMLVHVLAGNFVLALMPFTKLSHAVLFPFERVSSEVYWRFPAGAGDSVAAALHGRKEPALP